MLARGIIASRGRFVRVKQASFQIHRLANNSFESVVETRSFFSVSCCSLQNNDSHHPTCKPSIVKTFFSTASNTDVDDHHESGLVRLLTSEERGLLEDQKDLSERARQVASRVETVQVREYTDQFLEDILPDSTDASTFSIVVAGEFNAGKSTVINALLGRKLLETGSLPTTDVITVVVHDKDASESDPVVHNVKGRGGVDLYQVSDVPLLQDLTLIDTPGTNAVIADHTARTMKLLPTADLILFVTSADRPFSESERTLLRSIQAYRKSIVVVINKMDVLEVSGGSYGEEEKKQVLNFVADNASELLGARPIVIPVSARDALSAKLLTQKNESRIWQRSNFAQLESFLKETLTTETKVKSKLLNPIGVSEGMVSECINVLEKLEKELETDVATLALLQSQFNGWSKEMKHDTEEFRRAVKHHLQQEGERCQVFCDRLTYFDQLSWTLLDSTRFAHEWRNTRHSSADSKSRLQSQILELVQESAENVATRARAEGQAVIEYLGKRPAIKSHNLVGSVTTASRFDDTKKALAEKMSDSVLGVLGDVKDDPLAIMKTFRHTSIMSSAMTLSGVASACATALHIVDAMAGIGLSATLLVMGSYVVSVRNGSTINAYRKSWSDRSNRLDQALEEVSSKELQRVQRKILDGVSPYTRYVETEQERVQGLIEECHDVMARSHSLRRRIQNLRHNE